MDLLLRYNWPGNVRELKHIIEQAVILCENMLISPDDLRLDPSEECNGEFLSQQEKDTIVQILQACKGNKRRAARVLGISRNTLYLKLRRYGLLGEGGREKRLSEVSYWDGWVS